MHTDTLTCVYRRMYHIISTNIYMYTTKETMSPNVVIYYFVAAQKCPPSIFFCLTLSLLFTHYLISCRHPCWNVVLCRICSASGCNRWLLKAVLSWVFAIHRFHVECTGSSCVFFRLHFSPLSLLIILELNMTTLYVLGPDVTSKQTNTYFLHEATFSRFDCTE